MPKCYFNKVQSKSPVNLLHIFRTLWWPRAAIAKIYYHRKQSLNADKRLKKKIIIFENKI